MTDTPELHVCDDCGLHYTDRELAEACFEHCTTHHACSISITAQSVERRQRHTEPGRPGPAPTD